MASKATTSQRLRLLRPKKGAVGWGRMAQPGGFQNLTRKAGDRLCATAWGHRSGTADPREVLQSISRGSLQVLLSLENLPFFLSTFSFLEYKNAVALLII